MKRLVLISLLGLSLTGCVTAPPVWTRANTTNADFERDKAECMFEARKSINPYRGDLADMVLAASWMRENAELCMQMKGYTKMQGK